MSFKPRWYQVEAEQATFDFFETHPTGNPLIAMPTGTGKSVVIASFIRRAIQTYPGTRIMKLTHVKELIRQNFDELMAMWPTAPAGIYSAGIGRRDCHFPITYAGIASVARKAHLFGHIDLVVIDEAHTLGAKDSSNYVRFLSDLWRVNPNVRIIGFTATPYRLGMGHLTEGGLFTHVAYDLTQFDSFNRLIAEGYLAPLVPRRPGRELDVTGVRTVGGEFNLADLQAAVDREEITEHALRECLAQGEDRAHWLVFTTGVQHAIHVAERLNSLGVPAVAVHSEMGDEARDEAIAGWKSGKYRAAVNNNVLTTGVNFPAIDLIAVLRPTKSPGLWVQMLGRGTRPCVGKVDCLVLDFAGNTQRLGPINDPVLPRAKGGKGGGTAPVRCCPICSTWNHASARACVSCGHEFATNVKIKGQASELELIARDEAPVVEVFPVTVATYSKHAPRDGRPPSLKINYVSGLRLFTEYLCLEHGGLPRHKARDQWRERTTRNDQEPPETVDEALARVNELKAPSHIRVWVNRRYPEILARDYSGTGLFA